MSVVHAVACDYALAPTSTQWGMRDSHLENAVASILAAMPDLASPHPDGQP